MLQKTITYTDYNGTERTEDFFFNYKQSEIMEMELETDGGLAAQLQRITQKQDVPKVAKFFKNFVLGAYGERSADGKRFVKSKELREEFEQTEAYSVLILELLSDAKIAADFVAKVLPEQIADNNKPAIPAPPLK